MLAVVQNAFGGPEVLEAVRAPVPEPMPTEVLVRVHATSVNPVETSIRSGRFPLIGRPPFTLGWDVSGVVEKVGRGASRFQVGDEVYGMPFFPRPAGAYAEYVVSPSRMLARKPPSLDHTEAAALALTGLTAWQGLVDYAGVRPGDRVLIHAAGGGVGHLAVQIAKARGAYVIGTVSAGKADFVRSLGADELIDYRATDFGAAVRDADVVLDVVGGDYGERSFATLRPGGTFVTAVDHGNDELRAKAEAAGLRFVGVGVEPDHVALEALAGLVAQGRLRPHVSHVFPLAEAAKAHTVVEAGGLLGKVVLSAV
ncbi:NADP-dependent oxidoreductase [Streptomyces sp. V4-01]|uniref:NADP-dependent oxidoreductase n=1 Tax=Actinacidiphila polyblastidii TaxID=3110430 RepID=A0ABU7PL01_9ACTN|nr:NADP-dependent oxidoreductase [Streptomyces sp. V4-01]